MKIIHLRFVMVILAVGEYPLVMVAALPAKIVGQDFWSCHAYAVVGGQIADALLQVVCWHRGTIVGNSGTGLQADVDMFFSSTDQEHQTGTYESSAETKVVPSLGIGLIDVPRNGYTQEYRYGFGALYEAPRFREVLVSNSFQGEHLQGVREAAQAYSVQPDEENVTVIALNGTQS